jgi:hypothetical protein
MNSAESQTSVAETMDGVLIESIRERCPRNNMAGDRYRFGDLLFDLSKHA